MDNNEIERLVDQARKDPKFFHALVFNTESALKQVDYLDSKIKSNLVKNSPEVVIAKICGIRPQTKTAMDYEP
ncbi:MAG: hypothetical protein ACXAEF_04010 [Candidatus Thorarchaeota archaeon]